MRLTELAETIRDYLNTTPGEWDQGLGLEALVAIDWVNALKQPGIQVIISPELNQYTIDNSAGRKRIITLDTIKYIHLIIGKTFESLPNTDDVAPWDELKQIIDLREDLESLLIGNWPLGTQLVDVETQPIDEQQLDYRNFNALTSFGYQVPKCSLQQD